MNRTIQAILGVIFVLIIAFSAIVIFQCIGRNAKIDVTEQKLYTLTDGTRSILNKLNQPVKLKLYYAKKATLKASDQIKFFNNYYEYVRSLLEEYVSASGGKVKLEIIDPRPYSDSEVQALRYGLQKFPITEEENFFFGLVLQTPFGVEKVIPFFSPDRQSFIEYDISSLIDSAITREKSRVGVLSSIGVMGDDTSDYMVQMMRMQGQQPKGPWTVIEQLKQKYDVEKIDNDTADINDVDILLVVHPKKLPVQTQFAIDQFVLRGGRTIVCVDPHSIVDQPSRMQMQMQPGQTQSSELAVLLKTWGLEMPADTLAGDRSKALITTGGSGNSSRGQKMIGFLQLEPPECFNPESIITGNLNQVRVLFAGVLNEIPLDPNDQGNIERTPLLMTTDIGNSWSPELPVDLMLMNPARLMNLFTDGTNPVNMGYLVTGRFKSTFPEGVEYEPKTDPSQPADPNEGPKTIKLTGLTEAREDCAVVVFSDVDFISDIVAYQDTIFGKMVAKDHST